jgi:eukaryotic-like serine/threonine-protein kinase
MRQEATGSSRTYPSGRAYERRAARSLRAPPIAVQAARSRGQSPRHGAGDQVDHYEIQALLGAGSWAEAYRAIDTRTGRTVVLKSPSLSLLGDRAAFARHRREVAIVRSLDHPGVQGSPDEAHHRSEPYQILDYVDGDNLRHVIARRKPDALPIDLFVDWGIQLARTLSYLHAVGIVHRDLKPDNILLGNDGLLRIADFGAATRVGGRFTSWLRLANVEGTPEYLSPEQIQARAGDGRSDIYGLGLLLYELVAGVPAFSGASPKETMSMHLTQSPAPLRACRPDVPRELEVVVAKALRRRPEDRYQSVSEMLSVLTNLDRVATSPALALPDPPIRGRALGANAQVWLFIGLVATCYLAMVGGIIAATVALR